MDTFINQHPTSRHVLFIFCLVVKQPSQDASDECRWKVFQSRTLIAVDIIRTFVTARFQNCGYIKTLAIFCNVSQCCNFHHLSPSNTFPKYFADTAKHYFKSIDFIAFWTISFPSKVWFWSNHSSISPRSPSNYKYKQVFPSSHSPPRLDSLLRPL